MIPPRIFHEKFLYKFERQFLRGIPKVNLKQTSSHLQEKSSIVSTQGLSLSNFCRSRTRKKWPSSDQIFGENQCAPSKVQTSNFFEFLGYPSMAYNSHMLLQRPLTANDAEFFLNTGGNSTRHLAPALN